MNPTPQQEEALVALRAFFHDDERRVFILKGYAGTGKTFLVGHIAKALTDSDRWSVDLLAPTGRAARVLSEKTGLDSATIHASIYTMSGIVETADDPASFRTRFTLKAEAEFGLPLVTFVDEASMVSDHRSEMEFLEFGTGYVLRDLVTHLRLQDAGLGNKIVFVGDPAQLPPVGSEFSPALDAEYLRETYGLEAAEFELTDVVRQRGESAILRSATRLRELIAEEETNELSILPVPGEIERIDPVDARDLLMEAQAASNLDEWFFVTQSNAKAMHYNCMMRSGLLEGSGRQPIVPGDRLMVIKNDYQLGLSNGDLLTVIDRDILPEFREVWVGKRRVELIFRGASVGTRMPSGEWIRLDCKLLENVLFSERRGLTVDEQKALYVDFRIRNPDVKPETEDFMVRLQEDSYFNAVQVKFGYAATCHKAQGGEWDNVVVLFENQRRTDLDALRWAYTAITRARKRLYGIHLPSRRPWTPEG